LVFVLPYESTCLFNRKNAELLVDEGKQRNVPGIFNRFSESPLMLGAGTRLTSRTDFPGFVDIALEKFCIFVIYLSFYVRAKLTNL